MNSITQVAPQLAEALKAQLKIHHSVYTLPCIGEYLEESISNALSSINFANDWRPNRSHAVSKDLTIDSGPSVSIKSGTYDPAKQSLTFSGSRLGKHANIRSMVESVIENAADWYLCIAKIESDWKNLDLRNSKKIYYLFAFESETLPYDKNQWNSKNTKSGGVVYYADAPGFHAEIRSSMSHQLWTQVSEKIIGAPLKIEI